MSCVQGGNSTNKIPCTRKRTLPNSLHHQGGPCSFTVTKVKNTTEELFCVETGIYNFIFYFVFFFIHSDCLLLPFFLFSPSFYSGRHMNHSGTPNTTGSPITPEVRGQFSEEFWAMVDTDEDVSVALRDIQPGKFFFEENRNSFFF